MFQSFKTIMMMRETTAHASTQHASQVHKTYAATWQQWSFINILNILRTEWQQLNEEINEVIPDDGLKGSKHVGLFIKSVLSDFSVT